MKKATPRRPSISFIAQTEERNSKPYERPGAGCRQNNTRDWWPGAPRTARPEADRVDRLERELQVQNVEYVNKRDSLRLGMVHVHRIREGSWIDFQKRRLVRSGGTVEQYKQPHLVVDLQVIESFTRVPGPALLAVGSGDHEQEMHVTS
jgi:hypothetical protein